MAAMFPPFGRLRRRTPGVSVPLDKARSIAYHQRFVTAFPDIRFEVLGVVSEGDHVLVQWTASGTHAERLATVTGETIPPTRRRATVSGAMVAEARDGKLVRGWFYWDQLALLSQLGITEQPGSSCPRRASNAVGSAFGGCGRRPR